MLILVKLNTSYLLCSYQNGAESLQSLGGSFFMCRIYFQTAVRDLNILSMEKRSVPIYVAGRETVTWHRTDSAVCTCHIRP